MSTITRAKPWLPVLLLVAVVGVVYWPLFSGRVLFQRDVGRQIHPERGFLHDSWTQGDSPLWNPLIGLGQPTLANPLDELFYPPNIALLAGHSPGLTSAFLFGHLVLGALGMAALAYRLTRQTSAALVAGLAWALSGYTTSEVTAGLRLISGAYLPWCAFAFLGLSHAIRAGRSTRLRLAASAWAAIPLALCFLSGEVFFPFLAAGFALCVVIGDAMQMSEPTPAPHTLPPRAWGWRFAGGLCCAAIASVGLAMVVLLPAQRAAQATARTKPMDRTVAEVGSFHPWRMAELVAPGAMGAPYHDYVGGPWVGERGLDDRPLLYGCYLGSSVVVVALLAFGRRRRLAATLGIAAVAALMVAFGRHAPFHAVLRTVIPPLSYMRGPEKYLAIVFACTSLLAGLGCARLVEVCSKVRPVRLWPRALLISLLLLALAAGASWFPPALAAQVRTSTLVGLTFALAACASVWMAPRKPRWAISLLVGTVAIDLALAVFPLQNFAPADLLGAQPTAAAAILADAHARGDVAPPRVYRSPGVDAAIAAAAPPTSIIGVQRNLVATLIENHVTSFGIASVPGYDAAMPSTLSSLWLRGRRKLLGLLRLSGVAYAILPAETVDPPGLVPLLDPVPGARLYRVSDVLPRVYLARSAGTLPDFLALPSALTPEIIAGQQAILAPSPAPPASMAHPALGTESPGHCSLTVFSHARVEAECDATTSALAVFLEQWSEGWSATVDGRPAPLLRANVAMRAVPLSAGSHRIVMVFSAPGLRAGLIISLATLLGLLGLVVIGRQRSTRTQ